MKKGFLLSTVFLLSGFTANAKDLVIAGQDYPPFNWEENKEVKGGMVEVIKDLCKELKHNCKFQIVNLARGMEMMKSGEIDIFMSLFPNPERESFAAFSPNIIMTDIIYAAKSENKLPKMKSSDDMQGLTAAGVRGASSLKNYLMKDAAKAKIEVKEDTDNNTLVQRLINDYYGKKHIIAGSEDVIRYFAKKANGNYDVVFNHGAEGFKVAYSKKKFSDDEVKKMNEVIDKLKKSGAVKKDLSPFGLKTE